MNKKFDNILEKFVNENKLPQNLINQMATDIRSRGGSAAAVGANELGKLAQAAANTANPNLQKTALEKLQQLLDPTNKDVTEYTQIGDIPNELKTHIQSVFKPFFQDQNKSEETDTEDKNLNQQSTTQQNNIKTGQQYDPNKA